MYKIKEQKHFKLLKDSYKKLYEYINNKEYTNEHKLLIIQDEIDHTVDFIAELYEVNNED